MSHSFKKVWNTVSTVLVVLVVLLAVALVGVRLVGLNTYVVLSGSMEPTYHTGSLLYVKSVDPADIPTFVWDFLIQALFRPSDFSQLFCGISVLSPDFG